MTPQHPIVELAQGALERLAKVPGFGDACKGRAEGVERAWVRAPLSLAIGGTVSARSELFNYLCGKAVLDPSTRPVGSPALRIRRGKRTRFEALRDDGTTETHVLPPEQADDDVLRMRARAARAQVEEHQLALARIEKALPRAGRARPTGIWVFLWPLWWLATRRHRRMLADRRFTELAYDQACEQLATAEKDVATMAERIAIERGRFFESLRALASGSTLGGRVREVVVELADGPLPVGVELVEVTRSERASEPVDATFLVERDMFHAPHGADSAALEIGKTAEIVPVLPMVLGRARTLTIARRAREELEAPVTALDEEVDDTEESLRLRIERLEAMQIIDGDEFATRELTALRPQIAQSARLVLEQVRAHLGAELARLGDMWLVGIANSQSPDELKAVTQHVEASLPLELKRVTGEVRRLLDGGGVRNAQDLLPELLASLRPHGLDERGAQRAPRLPTLDIMPQLATTFAAKLSAGGLFKSFETKRADVYEKAQARVAQLVEQATAELATVEPALRAALEQTLRAELLAAIERQAAWLEGALVAERKAVQEAGLALAPLALARDRLKIDLARLVEGLAQLERDNAGLAAAVQRPLTSAA